MLISELSKLAGNSFWPILVYLCAVNVFAFSIFALDKYKSIHGLWRIPEKTLLTLALIGGSPAIFFGQKLLRHKTKKQPFGNLLLLAISLQISILALLIWQGST